MGVGVGDVAPDFTLPGFSLGEKRDFTLSEFRGSTVVLVFYPADYSPVCTVQLNSYNDDLNQFAELGSTILAISPQSVEQHAAFSRSQGGFGFPMLADADKEVGELYEIIGMLGLYRRSIFVIDPEGVITYAHRAVAGVTYRPVDELIEAVRSPGGSSPEGDRDVPGNG